MSDVWWRFSGEDWRGDAADILNEQASETTSDQGVSDTWWTFSGGDDWRGDAAEILNEQASEATSD
ncbi:hypothetical protein HD554DRAFT_2167312 [Boletus coccyginus]|nr:hypothetical protein HD554DRAFT_2167312 [Boletus coccyginus]